MTEQRRKVLEILGSMAGHPSAEEVYLAARDQDIPLSRATVYRTLSWLHGVGLVNMQPLATDPGGRLKEQFETGGDTAHHHFVCSRCGKIIEFELPLLEQAITLFARQQRVSIDRTSLTVSGACQDCQS
jgi:Fe2+ or Zn2+ uptake regulation protein